MCIAKTTSHRRNVIHPDNIFLLQKDILNTAEPDSVVSNHELVQSTIDAPPKVVQHHYVDHAVEIPSLEDLEFKPTSKGGVISPFPIKLYEMLEDVYKDNFDDIVSWQPHGRCFLVHKPKEFVDKVLPVYFQQKKYASFQRQLNLYGFNRITQGPDKGSYYHDCFMRGRKYLCHRMQRIKVKGTVARMASNPSDEPNFYSMPPLDESISSEDGEHDDVVLFEGMPFHFIDIPVQGSESNHALDPRLRRGSAFRSQVVSMSSCVTDSSSGDDDSSISASECLDIMFSDLSALADQTRMNLSDSELCDILEDMIH